MATSFELVLIVGAMLLSGAASTVLTKVMFTSDVVDLNRAVEKFQRPWTVNIAMFVGMALVGLADVRLTCLRSKTPSASSSTSPPPAEASPSCDGDCEEQAVEDKVGSAPVSFWRKFLVLGLPATCDVVGTILASAGLMFIPCSIYQMLRGSGIIFAAIFSRVLLGKAFNCTNRIGLIIATVGVLLVGLSQTLADRLEGNKDVSQQVLGMGLVLLSQIVQALQVILEELLLRGLNIPVTQMVSVQGVWGLGLTLCIIYPAMYLIPGHDYGHIEDITETLAMIASSREVASIICVLVITFGALNISGLSVTKELSGVHRKMIDAMRTSVIWIFGLSVHYLVDPTSGFSERWTRFSFLELLGFCVLILGQVIYSELLFFPGAKARELAADAERSEVATARVVVVVIPVPESRVATSIV